MNLTQTGPFTNPTIQRGGLAIGPHLVCILALRHRERGSSLLQNEGKILVVDDDPMWRDLFRTYLEDEGYEPLVASSGAEALQILGKEPCSVMLLDLRMPEMSGLELLERLPAEHRPRVVFVTAAPHEEVGRALWTGPHYYLPKQASPAELSLLLQALESH